MATTRLLVGAVPILLATAQAGGVCGGVDARIVLLAHIRRCVTSVVMSAAPDGACVQQDVGANCEEDPSSSGK